MPENKTHLVCLSIGSNIDPEKNIIAAIVEITNRLKILEISSVWSTPPVGINGSNFLNAAVLIQTDYDPDNLKCDILRPIEAKLGRVRSSEKFSPRTIDIDIQTVDGGIVDAELWNQVHLAVPVAELLPEIREHTNPIDLLQRSQDLRRDSPIEKIHLNLSEI